MNQLRQVIASFEELLLPTICMQCEVRIPSGWICPKCRKFLRPAVNVLTPENSPLYEIHAIWRYDGAIRLAIERWKYGKMPQLGELLLQEYYTKEWAETTLSTTYDAIVPIPPHWYHVRHRGFDPVHQIATHLAQLLDTPVVKALSRIGIAKPQVASSDSERESNVKGKFHCCTPVSGSILVVDDVITTGSTLREAAITLKSDTV
ncbi:MAG: hypothetical protein OEM52_14570, partial [bacterium]|nr:hypothetical protein [bacterium]